VIEKGGNINFGSTKIAANETFLKPSQEFHDALRR
jgi:hypothetical protein